MNAKKPPDCGGKRYDERKMKPLTDVSGTITQLSLFFYNYQCNTDSTVLSCNLNVADSKLSAELSVDREHSAYKFDTDFTAEIADNIKQQLRQSGLLAMNGWCVETNGLPLTEDCSLSITFSSGKRYHMSFNGGAYPPGFKEASKQFLAYIERLTDYAPSKCELIPPYVSPFVGTHVFVYKRDGKTQRFTVTVKNTSGTDNVELVSEGDFENEHIRANGSKVYGAREQYFLQISGYYSDSPEQNSTPNSLAAILYRKSGKMYLEPLQMGKKLPEKVDLEKTEE